MNRAIGVSVTLGATAALLFTLVGMPARGWSREDLARLSQAVDRGRRAGVRLVEDFPLVPYAQPEASPGNSGNGTTGSEVTRGPRRTRGDAALSGLRALHAAGLLRLADGRLDNAILNLEAAANQVPVDAAAWSDLSAALLMRAQEQDRPLDLLQGLEAVNRALLSDPRLPEALFNRAVALTRLHLREQARKAWEAYLDADRSSDWTSQAHRQIGILSEPTLAELWRDALSRLEEAAGRGDSTAVREIVARFPQAARLHAEEKVLPAWGAAVLARDETGAAGHLALARQIGAALAEVTRDAMIQDSVAVIDQAEADPAGRWSSLAKGHREYGRGMELYRSRQALNEARPLLAEASRLFSQAGTPFAGWADFYLGVCDHYGKTDEAARSFSRLRAKVSSVRYPVLAGVTAWMIGTLEHNLGQAERALPHFQAASALLDGVSAQEAGFVHLLIAEAYETLGEIDGAWRERLAALEWVRRSGDRRRAHSILHDAASALLLESSPGASPDFLEELLENDLTWANSAALCETYLLRGRIFDLLSRSSESVESFRAARQLASVIAQSAQKDRISAMLAVAEGESLASREPRKAMEILSAALASELDQDYYYQLTRLLAARARAHEALGDTYNAVTDLGQALEEYERVRGGVRDEQLRLSYFEKAQATFDEMIRLQAGPLADPERAFDYAERARARMLLDLTAGNDTSHLPGALTSDAIQSRLPQGVTLIEYALLPDQLLAWIVDRQSLRMIVNPAKKEDLDRRIHALRSAIDRRAGEEEIRSAASTLYDLLLRPLRPYLPAGGSLVFIPDRILVRVPFAALYDSMEERYLVADWRIAIAPSATLYVTATEKLRKFGQGAPWNALAVGDPAFDRNRHATLSRLPDAASEAAGVAALYEQSDLLLGEAATREAFLSSARGYRLIHFAGHALLHPASPRLSRLLFAPTGASSSGALYAHEIAGLRLDATEIVVLSACRTVADNEGSREGVTGLAAAFLAAGPPVVLSSLWNVGDRATQQLMFHFHRALRQGSEPATSLQAAQLQMLREPDELLRSPASWAGFEAFGGIF